MKRRPGFSRINATAFMDCCVKLDGFNDYGRIKGLTYSAAEKFAFSVEIKLNTFPDAAVTFLSRGFGATTDRYVEVVYDPTLNTNLGGWTVTAYDTTGGALRTFTVNDGDTARSHIGVARHLEFYNSSGTTWTFTVRSSDGTSLGTTTGSGTIGGFVSTTLDFWVGVDTTAGTAAPAAGDTSFGPFSVASLKFAEGASTATLMQVAGRELRTITSEVASPLRAYFRLTEGTGSVSTDEMASYKIEWGGNTPQWVSDTTLAYGQSALQFFGAEGEVIWTLATGTAQHFFSDDSTGFRKWMVAFVYVPKLASGETTVRDQTILWCGTSTTVPAPLGIRVVSDKLEVQYRDSAATVTVPTAGLPALSTLANTRLRCFVSHDDIATDRVNLFIQPEGTTSGYYATVNTAGGDPSSVSDSICIGRQCTSFTYPFTFTAASTAYGVIDDIIFFKDYYATGGNGPQILFGKGFKELNISDVVAGSNGLPSQYIQLVTGLRLNDGDGYDLATLGTTPYTSTAYLFPESDDGLWWDNGFIAVEDPPEIDGVFDFSRIGPKGALLQEVMVVCGGGIWGYDQDLATTRALGFIPKGGKCAYTQYGSVAFLARANGYRPMRCDGSAAYFLGIRAPVIPLAAAGNGAGSTFSAGTYRLYYTFRNPQTGTESNPSPVTSVTITANQNIRVTLLQRSSDFQVGQRRIYVTALGAAAGSQALLGATVQGNRTTTVSVDITGPPITGTLEYNSNREAPTGSVVKVFKDRMWVGGVPTYPTRAYRSAVGAMESYNWTTGFEDVDLDTGDPITGFAIMFDRLVAYMRDGRVFITPTGDTTAPFILSFASRRTGAVAHNAILVADHPPVTQDKQGLHVFMSDEDIHVWDGSGTSSIASPARYDLPSIEYTIRETLNRATTNLWTAGYYAHRKQLFFGVASSSRTWVDTVLIYDISQAIWTKYRLDAEFLATIDDANNVPSLMFGSHGFLCKFAGANHDGVTTVLGGSVSGSTSSSATYASPIAGTLSGLFIYANTLSDGAVAYGRIVYHTTTVFYVTDIVGTFAGHDRYYIGAAPWFADFVVDFGSPLTLKRLRWLNLFAGLESGESDGTIGYVILQDAAGRIASSSGYTVLASGSLSITATPPVAVDRVVGGLIRCGRLRLMPHGGGAIAYDSVTIQSGRPTIYEFAVEAEVLEAR